MALLMALIFTATGCDYSDRVKENYQKLQEEDNNNSDIYSNNYNWAIIRLASGEVVEGRVEDWMPYMDGCFKVIIDGITYMTHSNNITLKIVPMNNQADDNNP